MDKVRILRDLEYLNGGIVVMKRLSDNNKEEYKPMKDMFDEWNDIIYNIIDQIAKENDKNASDT